MKRIHLISTPRNVSTALMYSFAQRPDTVVVDEPLYAHYLVETGIDHPGREEVLQSQENDPQKVLKNVIFGTYDKEVLFLKNMAKHLVNLDVQFLNDLTNIIFIRNPKQILASFAKVQEKPTLQEIGTIKQLELFEQLKKSGNQPIILDSGALLNNPKVVLSKVCEAAGIPFYEAMLSWEAGPRPEDGVWAPYWYKNVHQTTGFKVQKTSSRELPEYLKPMYQGLKPYYDQLAAYAIKVN